MEGGGPAVYRVALVPPIEIEGRPAGARVDSAYSLGPGS